ncbi:hypothetical protein LZT27_14420 [Aeromonas veronii]|uniref:DNA-methyltransferase n=1 Tax=Aeromonas veronii TaxID=654 RepID=UPI002363C11D|nr:DNA methyltransferase [Aeromonas veronii]MDD1845787.1 hypothetical protein [Aeromonas veronii]
MYQILNGDCLERLKALPDNSVDSIVTYPPYGLKFMGKKWDYDVPAVEVWEECLRVLKPGGHLLAFSGTRTQHRMACRIEDAGFDLRDMVTFLYDTNETAKALIESLSPEQIKMLDATFGRDSMAAWAYGSGFPKSHNLDGDWQGWGTALKPAIEPVTVARKPFKGTVAANVLEHGAGVINIDGCRVGSEVISTHSRGNNGAFPKRPGETTAEESGRKQDQRAGLDHSERVGRWPANLIHDGSDAIQRLFPENAGAAAPVKGTESSAASSGKVTGKRDRVKGAFHADTGSASRFFYCAKASKKERGEGNNHPTVKPVSLMRYLCRLVTPPSGAVLDPFAGSGTTGVAAIMEGFNFIGIDMDEGYCEIAKRRISAAADEMEAAHA